ncbi:MAG: hypothetical protein KGJ66_06615 [Alphaproteobacteria bacterium]|nr:hypothetical protein [Alphaproteobacteria bacterium]
MSNGIAIISTEAPSEMPNIERENQSWITRTDDVRRGTIRNPAIFPDDDGQLARIVVPAIAEAWTRWPRAAVLAADVRTN